MGGRSALMGGTGVALGVDGAAPFLNPATITRIVGGRLAFSSRFYRFSEERFSAFHAPSDLDQSDFGPVSFENTDAVHHRLHSVPDSVCYFFPIDRAVLLGQRLSLCLTTTEEQELALTALSYNGSSMGLRLNQRQHFDVDWSRVNIGPTWGAVLTRDLAVGASLLVSFTRYKHAILGSSVLENTVTGAAATSTYESLTSASSWDLAPRIGATYELSQRFSVGASLTLPLVHLLGSIRQTYLNAHDQSRIQWSGEGSFRAVPPLELRLGVGAEWESFRFELDAFLTAGKSDYVQGELEREEITVEAGQVISRNPSSLSVNESTDTALNLALGAEVFLAERFSLLFGVQTDVNALRELSPASGEARLFRAKLDYFRTGIGICSYTEYGDLMAGLRFDSGTGKASPVNSLANPPALGRSSVQELAFMVVLAGTLNWASINQAVGELHDVVSGDAPPPTAEPPQPLREPRRE